MAQSEVESNTRKIISKQSTQQLQSKLEKGTLLGLSKKIALEVLEKRGIEVKEVIEVKKTRVSPKKEKEELKASESKSWTRHGGVKKSSETSIEKKKEQSLESKIESKSGKVEKKSQVKDKNRVELSEDIIKKVKELKGEGLSTYVIRKQLNLTWSRVNNILKNEKSK